MRDGSAFEAWFRLLETPGIGRERVRRLLAACGSAEAVLAAAPSTLRLLVGAAPAAALSAPEPLLQERLQAAQTWLAGGPDRHVLTIDDPAYPPQLLQSPDPPLLLYVQGRVAILSAPSLAIVGSRRPTPQGADNARAFALAVGQHGL
ncbi:MAG: DNA-processing protein DprA, partial [Pseudomonadota bacterium]|nr:DNA-processing protein DprA [Pseudomonadota bacterium]